MAFEANAGDLAGTPDVLFRRERVAVFCDGDFWHGRHLQRRLAKLRLGHNGEYWVAKLTRNVARDRATSRRLRKEGWAVLRVWETDVMKDATKVVRRIATELRRRSLPHSVEGSAAR